MVEINETDDLLRRVHPTHVIYDSNLGRQRPASEAFKNTEKTIKMSVDLRKLLNCITECLKSYPGHSLAVFQVALAHELGQSVEYSPRDENVAHSDVIGEKPPRVRREFALRSEFLPNRTLF